MQKMRNRMRRRRRRMREGEDEYEEDEEQKEKKKKKKEKMKQKEKKKKTKEKGKQRRIRRRKKKKKRSLANTWHCLFYFISSTARKNAIHTGMLETLYFFYGAYVAQTVSLWGFFSHLLNFQVQVTTHEPAHVQLSTRDRARAPRE